MKQQDQFDPHKGQPGPLGQLIRATREAEGLNQRQMAEAIGVSRELVSRLEKGSCRSMSPGPLMRFAKRFDINPADLGAITGWLLPSDLPDFAAYLRAKHLGCTDRFIDEMTQYYDFVKQKHSL